MASRKSSNITLEFRRTNDRLGCGMDTHFAVMKINTDPLFLLHLGNTAVLGWFARL